jgi:hypothetical protein
MKVGVALSGCDLGGICAHRVLEEIERQGYEIVMVSACSIPAAAALFWSVGLTPEKADSMAKRFLKDVAQSDLDTALAAMAETLTKEHPRQGRPVCVAACNLTDGRMVVFTDTFSLNSDTFSALPLQDPYDMLSATVSGTAGLGSYVLGDYRLCDYSARYGCPVAPLRLCGLSRVLSIAFLPAVPSGAYEAALLQSLGRTCSAADLHLPILLPQEANFEGCVLHSVKLVGEALANLEKAETS